MGSSQIDLLDQLIKEIEKKRIIENRLELQSKISDKILDFSDRFSDLPRGDKQGVSEALAYVILDMIN